MDHFTLSEKSQKFIDDLRIYLFSSGKNDKEINEITEELEAHIYEAEINNKSIEQIIGASPKQYMQSISQEMKTDIHSWMLYIPLIIIGAFSFSVFGDLLQGTLSYSIIIITGTILYSLLFTASVFTAFRYIAKNQLSRIKELLILGSVVVLSLFFIFGIIIADSFYNSPTINFGIIGSIFTGLIFFSFIITFSIWSKTVVLPLFLAAIHLPDLLLRYTSFQEESQLAISITVTYIFIAGYLFYVVRKEKRSSE
ncbi:HAAS domain-containing protein [Alkalicoccus daliensis]|uniref:Uncharacterized membrane-anchored protein n=1 Tax=Alkalicoccus daliensis TaxID=745820 RepID=A0A1G9ZFD0_9BACI|nr:hypothetical protein [Alkalicoccus daliensis]SDN19163.1 Uncharacterized membrane-anchored protein [Alkalicoccus daliensis]